MNSLKDPIKRISPSKVIITGTSNLPKILAITVISLCHGRANVELVTPIVDTTYDEVKTITPSITTEGPENDIQLHTVNYDDKFKFKYSTIPYCGVFSNVGSCPGLPTSKAPSSFMTKQNIVQHEVKLLECKKTKKPGICNHYMLLQNISPKIARMIKEHTVSEDVDEDNMNELLLTMHSDYKCQSLLDKTYASKVSEILTSGKNATIGDAGKLIILTKIEHPHAKHGGTAKTVKIVKTVILGDVNFKKNILELSRLARQPFHKSTVNDIVTVTNDIDYGDVYRTTTEKIIKLINELKERNADIPVRFFDSSCNSIHGIKYKRGQDNITPSENDKLMLKKINDYFAKIQKTTIGVFGGNQKITKKRILKHNKTKNAFINVKTWKNV